MPGHPLRWIKANLPTGSQKTCKLAHMFRQCVLVQAPEPHVEEIAFAKAPAIALKIVTKIEFRSLFLNRACGRLLSIHLELNFLGHDRLLGPNVPQKSR